jgi:hypothetical protein
LSSFHYSALQEKIWIRAGTLNAADLNNIIYPAKNALITAHPSYYTISALKGGIELSPQHLVLFEEEIQPNYCQLCIHRLISITKGCKECLFTPVQKRFEFDIPALIHRLLNLEYYEVDLAIFLEECKTKSIH